MNKPISHEEMSPEQMLDQAMGLIMDAQALTTMTAIADMDRIYWEGHAFTPDTLRLQIYSLANKAIDEAYGLIDEVGLSLDRPSGRSDD